jgi:ribosome biogenesis GTPase A
MLIYSEDSPESFEYLAVVWQKIERIRHSNNFPVVVVANKTDLAYHKVSTQSGEDFARSHGVPFIAVSVRTGKSVDKILPTLIREYRKKNPRTHFSAPKERKCTIC